MLTETLPRSNGEVVIAEVAQPAGDLLREPITVHLLSPVEQDGKVIEVITLNFAGLTDEDWDYCERTWRSLIGNAFEMDFMSRTYQRIVAARAGDFPLMLFKQLKGADNRRLTSLAFTFLARCSAAENPRTLIKRLAVGLSMATYTPIPFWLKMTVSELLEYIEVVKELSKPKDDGQADL